VDVSANLTPAGGLDITSSFVATPFSFDDTLLSFHVHANQGPITAIELDFDGFFMGLAIASVTETAKDVHGNVVGFLNVSCSNLGCDRQDPAYERFDIPLNGAYTDLYITKDINVTAAGGFAGASYVHQGYVTATQVPEPGSMALLGAGVLGLVLFSPRRGAARARSRRGSSVRL
jgi:hypothetical protein